MTVFVTTHYMDEADQACDRVGIIDGGRVVATDTPSALKATVCRDIVSIRTDGTFGGGNSLKVSPFSAEPMTNSGLRWITVKRRAFPSPAHSPEME
ncbi:hypothetical protein [Methanoculleus chikugoensis]|uniref:hypothetical protein n=1 Tax=Methanoculleus chikugoensis TaxID=118126 RepID=UPI000A4C4A85|nr:hypothetical protein [Methanoculleus chikugoensis]